MDQIVGAVLGGGLGVEAEERLGGVGKDQDPRAVVAVQI